MARTLYIQELESVRHNLIQMGETTTALLSEAIQAVPGCDSGSAERASEMEAKTDHQLRTIHDQCLSLIMAQIPEIGSRTRELLPVAIDGWRSEEAGQGLSVAPQAAAIRSDCQTLYGTIAQLTSASGEQAAGAAPLRNSR